MASEIVDAQTASLIEKALPFLGSAMAAIGVFVVKAVGGKVSDLTHSVESHHERITVLEHTYVSREDLEGIVDTLNRDLRVSFERAHTRIDEIYKNPRKD